jgi:sRNA-binding protein
VEDRPPADDSKGTAVTEEMTATTTDGTALQRGQEVLVKAGTEPLGAGVVDAITEDGSIVWVVFGGTTGRRMFIPEDQARFTVLPPSSIR